VSETRQAALWRGAFGDAYIDRNACDPAYMAALTASWARILRCLMDRPPGSLLEGGANIGLNLRALSHLTTAELYAVEPNAKARQRLAADRVLAPERIMDGLLTGIPLPDGAVDLSFTRGVLIHVPPSDLLQSCRELVRVSRRYVIANEYFSPRPETIPYRGQKEALFKRDFGAFYLDNFPELRVVDYGFDWKRVTGMDDLTWWVFEKAQP
jgi:spore coat polysaccharide biosynthesis protein SpsF